MTVITPAIPLVLVVLAAVIAVAGAAGYRAPLWVAVLLLALALLLR